MVAFLGYAVWVTLKHVLKRRPVIVPSTSEGEVDHVEPMSRMRAIALLSTLQSATSFFLPLMVVRSVCAESPSRRRNRNPCSANLASACQNIFSSIANVV